MFGFIQKMFIGLLTSVSNASNHTKCVSLNIQQCMIQPIPINLHPNEYSQGLRYCSSTVNLDRYVGSCNTLDHLSKRVCVSNGTDGLNVNAFHINTVINESKIFRKHLLLKSNKFNSTKYNSNQK